MKKCNREGCGFETPDVNELAGHIICHLDQENVQDILDKFPSRYPFPVKCVLYLAFHVCTEVPWEAIHKLLVNMGYVEVTLQKDISDGLGTVYATSTWAGPD